jgi:hypothetical protein
MYSVDGDELCINKHLAIPSRFGTVWACDAAADMLALGRRSERLLLAAPCWQRRGTGAFRTRSQPLTGAPPPMQKASQSAPSAMPGHLELKLPATVVITCGHSSADAGALHLAC